MCPPKCGRASLPRSRPSSTRRSSSSSALTCQRRSENSGLMFSTPGTIGLSSLAPLIVIQVFVLYVARFLPTFRLDPLSLGSVLSCPQFKQRHEIVQTFRCVSASDHPHDAQSSFVIIKGVFVIHRIPLCASIHLRRCSWSYFGCNQ